MFFIMQMGPCAARPVMVPDPMLGAFKMMPRPFAFLTDWPMFLLYMAMLSGLLAASFGRLTMTPREGAMLDSESAGLLGLKPGDPFLAVAR